MSDKHNAKSLAAAVGAVMIGSVAVGTSASADVNPFGMTELSSGYMVAGAEGKCGGKKAEGEGKCGEGKCGGKKTEGEGKCGEGKCGGKK